MPNFNPQDELLKRWAAECAPETLRYLGSDNNSTNPITMLDTIDAMPGPFRRDRDRLRTLLMAELAGAKRARERAEWLTSHEYLLGAYPNGGPVKMGAESAAREILEAFDGK